MKFTINLRIKISCNWTRIFIIQILLPGILKNRSYCRVTSLLLGMNIYDQTKTHLGYIPKTGSLLHPRSLTPLGVGSIRKCLTRSTDGSPVDFVWTLAGTVATFSAKPNAPGKELLSLTTKVPGALSFNNWMAEKEVYKIYNIMSSMVLQWQRKEKWIFSKNECTSKV